MSWPTSIDRQETRGSRDAGMEIFKEIRKRSKDIPIIAYTATQDRDLKDTLIDDPKTTFISKWSSPSIRDLVKKIHETLGAEPPQPPPVPFIVHGHNEKMKLSLKNYLQNILHLPEPIILHEQPNQGRTIIEKFEEYAERSYLIFVLLTPDDLSADRNDSLEVKRRARQNVILEMGYFLGLLGRRSGRVILLHQGPLELPGDLSGLIYIDISNGIEAVGEQIRKEIQYAG